VKLYESRCNTDELPKTIFLADYIAKYLVFIFMVRKEKIKTVK